MSAFGGKADIPLCYAGITRAGVLGRDFYRRQQLARRLTQIKDGGFEE